MIRDKPSYLEMNRLAYDATARQYAERVASDKRNDEPIVERVLRNFLLTSNSKRTVLDVGCGAGANLAMFAARGWQPVGMDLSSEMCRYAHLVGGPDCLVLNDDFLTRDFGDQQFDLVFAKAFVHLFPRREFRAVLEKLDDLAKQDGVIYIATTVESDSRVGPLKKSDYRGAPSRYRRRVSEDQILWEFDRLGAMVIDEWINRDPRSRKTWMNFCLRPSHGRLA